MIFWRKFNRFRVPTWPEKDGMYSCTVKVSDECPCVMDLYWFRAQRRFIDIRRQDVFDEYEVMIEKSDNEIGEYSEILHTDDLCDWTDSVVAWRKLPKAYGLKKGD